MIWLFGESTGEGEIGMKWGDKGGTILDWGTLSSADLKKSD